MPVPTTIQDCNANPSLNSPSGSDPMNREPDNYLRSFQSILRKENGTLITATMSPVNVYAISTGDAFTTVAAGQQFRIKFPSANTTAATLAVDTSSAMPILLNGLPLVANDIKAGTVCNVIRDTSSYHLWGARGDLGAQGIQGVQGIQGIQGIQGPAGNLSPRLAKMECTFRVDAFLNPSVNHAFNVSSIVRVSQGFYRITPTANVFTAAGPWVNPPKILTSMALGGPALLVAQSNWDINSGLVEIYVVNSAYATIDPAAAVTVMVYAP